MVKQRMVDEAVVVSLLCEVGVACWRFGVGGVVRASHAIAYSKMNFPTSDLLLFPYSRRNNLRPPLLQLSQIAIAFTCT